MRFCLGFLSILFLVCTYGANQFHHGIERGRREMQAEAVARGYAEMRLKNPSDRQAEFHWKESQ